MTAEEMLRLNGFVKIDYSKNKNIVAYEKKTDLTTERYYFHNKEKAFAYCNSDIFHHVYHIITRNELQAIKQQLKELGW